jgi:hypothetical protein
MEDEDDSWLLGYLTSQQKFIGDTPVTYAGNIASDDIFEKMLKELSKEYVGKPVPQVVLPPHTQAPDTTPLPPPPSVTQVFRGDLLQKMKELQMKEATDINGIYLIIDAISALLRSDESEEATTNNPEQEIPNFLDYISFFQSIETKIDLYYLYYSGKNVYVYFKEKGGNPFKRFEEVFIPNTKPCRFVIQDTTPNWVHGECNSEEKTFTLFVDTSTADDNVCKHSEKYIHSLKVCCNVLQMTDTIIRPKPNQKYIRIQQACDIVPLSLVLPNVFFEVHPNQIKTKKAESILMLYLGYEKYIMLPEKDKIINILFPST